MRSKSEKAIHDIYKQEDIKTLQEIIWTRSPVEGARKCIELGDTKSNLTYSGGYGSHDANWLGFYEFFRNELKIEEAKDLDPLMELSKVAGWWWPYENICIVSELPLECHVNEAGDLHKDGGAALLYSDGFAMYYLNGIEVTKEVSEIKPKDITKEFILNEQNVDIRREIIRKVGNEKLVTILGAKTVDTFNGYDLLEIDYGDKSARPHLKMTNPSIKCLHIEGVSTQTKTVKDAICFRNGLKKYSNPEHLS